MCWQCETNYSNNKGQILLFVDDQVYLMNNYRIKWVNRKVVGKDNLHAGSLVSSSQAKTMNQVMEQMGRVCKHTSNLR